MRIWRIAVAVVVVAALGGCKDKGKAAATGSGSGAGTGTGAVGQTFADAIGILCGKGAQPPDVAGLAPAERQTALSTWLDTTIKEPQARNLLAALGDARDRAASVQRAAGEAGITDCKPLEMFRSRAVGGVTVPEVTAGLGGSDALDQELAVITASTTGIMIDGAAIVQVDHGAIAASDADKLAASVKQAAAHHTEAGGTFTRVVVAIDPTLTVAMFGTIAKAAIAAGARRVDLAVLVGNELRVVPVVFPDAAAMQNVKPRVPPPVRMMVAITADKLVVASLSGQEGTIQIPKAEVALAPLAAAGTALQTALGDIVKQHWSTATRDPDDLQIVVLAAPTTTVATFAQVAAWVRAAADGTPLFAEVAFGAGFE